MVLGAALEPVGAHNSVVGADQGFRAPSWGPGIGTRFGTRGLNIGPHRGRSTTTAEFRAPTGPVRRKRIIDPWLAKIEEWVERSCGKIRRRPLLCQAEGVGVRGFGPHGAPSGGGGQEQLRGGSAAGVSAVDP